MIWHDGTNEIVLGLNFGTARGNHEDKKSGQNGTKDRARDTKDKAREHEVRREGQPGVLGGALAARLRGIFDAMRHALHSINFGAWWSLARSTSKCIRSCKRAFGLQMAFYLDLGRLSIGWAKRDKGYLVRFHVWMWDDSKAITDISAQAHGSNCPLSSVPNGLWMPIRHDGRMASDSVLGARVFSISVGCKTEMGWRSTEIWEIIKVCIRKGVLKTTRFTYFVNLPEYVNPYKNK